MAQEQVFNTPVQGWSDEDVVIRWLKIAKLKRGSQDGTWEPSAARIRFGRVVGRVRQISQAAHRLGRRWLYGMNQAAQAFT